MRAASSTAIAPVPLSVPPVARSHESRCAPTSTTSSGVSLPRISATVLYCCSGSCVKVFVMSASMRTVSPRASKPLELRVGLVRDHDLRIR